MTSDQRYRSVAALLRRHQGSCLLGLGVVAWILIFGRFGDPSLLDPDEAHYAQLTREMIRARSWFVPLLDGSPYIDKPVFFHWLQMASMALFGESEFALRLPSALAGVCLLWTTRWLAAEIFGAAIGNVAALMFATLPFTFALAHLALFDMTYTAFLFGAVACLIVAVDSGRSRAQYAAYALLAVAVMIKGPIALLLVLLWVGVAVVFSPGIRQDVRRLQWPVGLLLIVVCASPWFVYMWMAFNERFVHDYLLAGNLWYFTGPKAFSTRASDYTFYLRTFAGAFFPWSVVAIGYSLDTVGHRRRTGEQLPRGELLLGLWVAVILGFFSIARFKLDWYIYPAAPACCVLAARGWLRNAGGQGWWTRAAVVTTGVVFVAGGLVAAAAIFEINLGTAASGIVLPIALIVGGAVLLWSLARGGVGRTPAVAVPVITLLAVYIAVVAVGFPILERSRPTAPVGRWVRRHTRPGTAIGTYGLDDWRASIRYYSDRTVVPLTEVNDVETFLRQTPDSFVLMLRQDFDRLRNSNGEFVEIAGRPAIVGRSGRYLRRQIWGSLVIVADRDNQDALASTDRMTDPR
jgi:4-amino-4-deoxy-L-arabinose transferase-like glycosyltransferase